MSWLPVLIYEPARKAILNWPLETKKDLGSILTKLQKKEKVGPPDIKKMCAVNSSCFEIRMKGPDRIFRVFYVLESRYGILVFHSFIKKAQKTPQNEIETAKQRLQIFLEDLKYEKK